MNKLLKYIKKHRHDILLVGIIVLLISLFNNIEPIKTIQRNIENRTINKNIKGKERIIERHFEKIKDQKKDIDSLNFKLDILESLLQDVKNKKDTFKIVQIQDTLISVLYRKVEHKDSVIAYQDTIINAQRYIINSKDTIITNQKLDIKKLRRQRNISFGANALLGTLLILK